MEKKKLTKEEIINCSDLPVEEIYVPEWKGIVYLRGMNASERDEFEAQLFVGEGKDRKLNIKNLRARLVALTCVDEKGANLFTPDEVEKLGKKSATVINRLFDKAQKLSGIGQTDIDDYLKNSGSGQPD